MAEEEEPNFLKKAYYAVEDKYYALIDFLNDKIGLPVVKYFVDPIESRGLPSLPFFVLLCLAIVGGIYFLLLPALAGATTTLEVQVMSGETPVDGATVILLRDSKEFMRAESSDGIAVFEGVPVAGAYRVRVLKTGYEAFEEEVTLSPEPVSLTASLRTKAAGPTPTPPARRAAYNFIVRVVDTAGTPISGASVEFSSPSRNGDRGSARTDSTGQAVLGLSTQDQILAITVSADGYVDGSRAVQARAGMTEIALVQASTTSFDSSGDSSDGPTSGDYNDYSTPAAVNVRVFVKDEGDNGVPCTVTLYDAETGEPLDSDKQSTGVFYFEDAVYSGNSVYVVVRPVDEEAFVSQTTPSLEAVAGQDLEFNVVLQSRTVETSRVVSVAVKDEEGNPVQYASVALYSDSTNALIASQAADEQGNASFVVSSSLELGSFYATAYASGFLPENLLVTSSSSTIVLSPLLAGNNAAFEVEVKDPDGNPVSGARVSLVDGDGRFFGAPTIETDFSGLAGFNEMPVNTQMRAKARYRNQYGSSDVFTLSAADEERVVPLVLSHATGKAEFTVYDVASLQPVEGASIELVYARESQASCTTDEKGVCVVDGVIAGREYSALVTATAYAPLQSDSFAVAADSTLKKSFYLVPSALANQTVVRLASVTDEQGNDVTASELLSKGGYYTFHVVAAFGATEKQGVFVRVGDKPTAAEESIVLTAVDYSPSEVGQPVLVKGTTYREGSDASTDLLNSPEAGEAFKWAYVEYAGLAAGSSVELSARVFVKPVARPQQDQVKFYYRAWSQAGLVFDRAPKDDVLGTAQSGGGKDFLYAKTNFKSYGVSDGKYYCNAEGTACLVVSFSSADNPSAKYPSPFKASLGEGFYVNYEVRAFTPVEAAQAYVRITSPDKVLRFTTYDGDGNAVKNSDFDVRVLLGSSGPQFAGSLGAEGIAPTQLARVQVEFGDARGPILSTSDSFAVIEGRGRLVIVELSPTTFEVGKKRDLRLRILSGERQPIEDARISLEEMDDEASGAPFAGEPPAPVVGDGSEENGLDGYYKIPKVRTKAPGVFVVKVRKEGYAETVEELTSTTAEFLAFSPDEGIEVECRGGTMSIENILDSSLDVLAAVGPGDLNTACVNVSGIGVTKVRGGEEGETVYSIKKLRPGKSKRLKLTPVSPGDCTIAFSSSDPRTGANYYSEYEVSNLCTEYAGAVPTAGNVSTEYYFRVQGSVWYDPLGGSNPARVKVNATDFDEDASQEIIRVNVSFWNQDSVNHSFVCRNRVGTVVFSASEAEFGPGAIVVHTFTKAGLYKCRLENGNEARLKIKSRCPHHGWNYYAGFMAACMIREGLLKSTPVGDIVNYGASAWEVAASIPFHVNVAAGFTQWDVMAARATYPNPAMSTLAATQYGAPICAPPSWAGGTQYGYTYSSAQGYWSGPSGTGQISAYGYTPATQSCYGPSVANSMVSPANDYIARSRVNCVSLGSSGAKCTIKITPNMRFGGAAIAFDNVDTAYLPFFSVGQAVGADETEAPGRGCFQFLDLDAGAARVGTSLGQAMRSITGMGMVPLSRSFAFLFNPDDRDECVKYVYENGRLRVEPVVSEGKWKIMTGATSAYRITLKVEALEDDAAAPFYIISVPASGTVSYHAKDNAVQVEPYFIVNNVVGKNIHLKMTYLDENGGTHENEEVVIGGREQAMAGSQEETRVGVYPVIVSNGTPQITLVQVGERQDTLVGPRGEVAGNGIALATAQAAKAEVQAAGDLLDYDVVGSVGTESISGSLASLPEEAKTALQCSGTKFCAKNDAEEAYNSFKDAVKRGVTDAYKYVPYVYKRDPFRGVDQAFENCLDALANEMIADRASEAVCKTFFKACKDEYDEEEEEIEEGEEENVDFSTIGSSVGTALKNVFCQGTQMGQNMQALESMFGDQRMRQLLRQAFGRLLNAGIFQQYDPLPLLDIQEKPPTFYSVFKTADPVTKDSGRGVKLVEVAVKPEELVQALQYTEEDASGEHWVTVYEERGLFSGGNRPAEWQRLGSMPYRYLVKAPIRALWDAIVHAATTPNVDYAFPYLKLRQTQAGHQAYEVVFDDEPNLATLNKFKLKPLSLQAASGEEIDADQLHVVDLLQNEGAPMAGNDRLQDGREVFVASCWEIGGALAGTECAGKSVLPEGVEVRMENDCPSTHVIGQGTQQRTCLNKSDGLVELKLYHDEDLDKDVLRVLVKHPWSYPENVCSATYCNTAENYSIELLKYFANESYSSNYFSDHNLPCEIIQFTAPQQGKERPPRVLLAACPGRDASEPVNVSLAHVASHPQASSVTVQGNSHLITIPNTQQSGGYAFLIETNVTLCAGVPPYCRSLRYSPSAFVTRFNLRVDVNGSSCTFTRAEGPGSTTVEQVTQEAQGQCSGLKLVVGGPFDDYLVLGVNASERPVGPGTTINVNAVRKTSNSLNYSIASTSSEEEGMVLRSVEEEGVALEWSHDSSFTPADHVVDEVTGADALAEFRRSGSRITARFLAQGQEADWAVLALVDTSTAGGWKWMKTAFKNLNSSTGIQELGVDAGGVPRSYNYLAELFVCEDGWVIGGRQHNARLREAIRGVSSGADIARLVREHCVIAHVHLNRLP